MRERQRERGRGSLAWGMCGLLAEGRNKSRKGATSHVVSTVSLHRHHCMMGVGDAFQWGVWPSVYASECMWMGRGGPGQTAKGKSVLHPLVLSRREVWWMGSVGAGTLRQQSRRPAVAGGFSMGRWQVQAESPGWGWQDTCTSRSPLELEVAPSFIPSITPSPL